jgi:hypothetical protein
MEDYGAIAAWLNTLQTDLGWVSNASTRSVDDAPNYADFDALTAGKRDSWARFLGFDRDFSRSKVRKWVTDVWGNATTGSNSESILLAATRKITRAEKLLAGAAAITGTVTAFKLDWEGSVDIFEIGGILSA